MLRQRLLAGGLAMVLVAACASPTPNGSTSPQVHPERQVLVPAAMDTLPSGLRLPLARSDASAGRTLYRRHCAQCHGPDGAGDGPAAAVLGRKPPDLGDPERMRALAPTWMQRSIWEGEGAMPPWSHVLSPQESWDLTFYLWSLSLAPVAGDGALYETHCAACHEGGPAAPAPPLDTAGRAASSLLDELGRLARQGDSGHPPIPGLDTVETEGALRHAWTLLYEPLPTANPRGP